MPEQTFTASHPAQIENGAAWGGLGARMHFAADEEVYAQDEEADLFYQLVRGAVRTTRFLSDGRRQVGDFYYPGDLFGFEAGPLHRLCAEAIIDCEVLVVRRSALRQFTRDGCFERQLWEATSTELGRAQTHLLLLGRKTAAEKVAGFLMGVAERYRGDTIDLPMGRQDMADYLGLTIETVSRMLTQLQGDRLVRFESCRRFTIVNRAALVALASD